MIVSASVRTDIPAFYGDWLMRRIATGHALVANPFGGRPYRVSLAPGEVDGLVLWTRNVAPLLPHLGRLRALAPVVVQFTVTGYPRALEARTIDADAATAQIRTLADRLGRRAVVWRYDPVVLSTATPEDWHVATFDRLARALRDAVDEVVLSCVSPYRKTARNLDAAARRHGFAWRDPEPGEKRALLARLAAVAAGHGLVPTLCAQPEFLVPGMAEARCIDADRLGDVAGQEITAPERGNRPGCRCAAARDIGAYDTCPHGCAYCYAVADRDRSAAAQRAHDPDSEMLVPGRGQAHPASPQNTPSPLAGEGIPEGQKTAYATVSTRSPGFGGSAAGPPLATPTMAGRSRRSCCR